LLLTPLPGDLKFENVSLRYFPGGPLALRHVNFHVQDCEKVGKMILLLEAGMVRLSCMPAAEQYYCLQVIDVLCMWQSKQPSAGCALH
jgi:hypothetical protein